MTSELWEIVRVDELKVGDVVLDLRGGAMVSYEIDPDLVEIAKSSPKNFYPPKLRRHTGHHPDVLMRALKIALKSWDDDRSTHNHISWWIDKAEAEIAEERESNE